MTPRSLCALRTSGWLLPWLALSCVGPDPARIPGRGPVAAGTRAFSVTTGALDSVPEDPRDLQGASARFSLAHRFRDGFALVGELDAVHYDGGGDGFPSVDASGVGASGLLRWHAIQGPAWSAFVEYGLGVLATDEDFPPGGTSFNGTRQAGLGLMLELSQALRLTLGVRQQHVSNGQGVDPDNPSWEGIGGYVGLVFDLYPKAGRRPAPQPVPEAVDPWEWSVGVEGRWGELGEETGGGGVVFYDQQLLDGVFAQARVSLDDVDGESLTEWGLAAYGRVDQGLFGIAYDQQDLDGFQDREVSAFGELYANDLVTAVGTLGFENRNLARDRVFGAMLLRVYPFPQLMIESGVSARDTYDDFGAASFDVPLGLELALPSFEGSGLSLFAQDDMNDDARIVGLRLRLGSGADPGLALIERHRAAGPLRNRP